MKTPPSRLLNSGFETLVEAVTRILQANRLWARALKINDQDWGRRSFIDWSPPADMHEVGSKTADAFAEAARMFPSPGLALAVADMYFLDLHRETAAVEVLKNALLFGFGDVEDWSPVLMIGSLLLKRAGLKHVNREMREYVEVSESNWSWDERSGLTVLGPGFLPELYRVVTDPEHSQLWLRPATTIFECFLRDWADEGGSDRPDLHVFLGSGDQEVLSALSGLYTCWSKGAVTGLGKDLFENNSEGHSSEMLEMLREIRDGLFASPPAATRSGPIAGKSPGLETPAVLGPGRPKGRKTGFPSSEEWLKLMVQIAAEWEEGVPLKKLARRHNVSPRTIGRWIAEYKARKAP